MVRAACIVEGGRGRIAVRGEEEGRQCEMRVHAEIGRKVEDEQEEDDVVFDVLVLEKYREYALPSSRVM